MVGASNLKHKAKVKQKALPSNVQMPDRASDEWVLLKEAFAG